MNIFDFYKHIIVQPDRIPNWKIINYYDINIK